MDTLFKFLTFEQFISPSLLFIMYYFGALLFPFLSWFLVRRFVDKYLSSVAEMGKQAVIKLLPLKQRLLFYAVFFVVLIMFELMWCMMIEFFMAYFQMHAALVLK